MQKSTGKSKKSLNRCSDSYAEYLKRRVSAQGRCFGVNHDE